MAEKATEQELQGFEEFQEALCLERVFFGFFIDSIHRHAGCLSEADYEDRQRNLKENFDSLYGRATELCKKYQKYSSGPEWDWLPKWRSLERLKTKADQAKEILEDKFDFSRYGE